jgi:hypothetical protein
MFKKSPYASYNDFVSQRKSLSVQWSVFSMTVLFKSVGCVLLTTVYCSRSTVCSPNSNWPHILKKSRKIGPDNLLWKHLRWILSFEAIKELNRMRSSRKSKYKLCGQPLYDWSGLIQDFLSGKGTISPKVAENGDIDTFGDMETKIILSSKYS